MLFLLAAPEGGFEFRFQVSSREPALVPLVFEALRRKASVKIVGRMGKMGLRQTDTSWRKKNEKDY